MQYFANPARFQRLARRLSPWVGVSAAFLLCLGFYWALLRSPPDYQQGETVRIMYVHVPAAWLALFIYSSMAGAALVALVWRHPLASLYAKAVAPVGLAFTGLCLLTGMLWGRPMWGAWWAWDARLTSVLILFFLYLGYIALIRAFDRPERGLLAGNILLLLGAVNIPIIKFSVDWWNTLHQPASISRLARPAIDVTFLIPLLIMAGGYFMVFAWLALRRLCNELLAQKLALQSWRQSQFKQNLPVAFPASTPGVDLAVSKGDEQKNGD
jgi:heme exporter protein C